MPDSGTEERDVVASLDALHHALIEDFDPEVRAKIAEGPVPKALKAAKSEIERLRAEIEAVRAALGCAYLCVYLDGRNEHGSHVLELPGSNIDPDDRRDLLSTLDDQDLGFAEEIIKDAEAFGYAIGNSVVTLWDITHDPEWGPEFEYRRISRELTGAMCGTPEEQRAMLDAGKKED